MKKPGFGSARKRPTPLHQQLTQWAKRVQSVCKELEPLVDELDAIAEESSELLNHDLDDPNNDLDEIQGTVEVACANMSIFLDDLQDLYRGYLKRPKKTKKG